MDTDQTYTSQITVKQDENSGAPTYIKRSGTAAIRGQWYETKLLSLFLFRALRRDNITSFNLATNVDEAGAFDDIVMQYTENGTDKWFFLQSKHKESKQVSFKDNFLSSSQKADFSLVKYFKSFLTLKVNLHNECFTHLKKYDLGPADELIIYTTIGVDYVIPMGIKLTLTTTKVDSNNLLYTSDDGEVIRIDGSLEILEKAAVKWYYETLAEIIGKQYLHENASTDLEIFVSEFIGNCDNETSLKLLFQCCDKIKLSTPDRSKFTAIKTTLTKLLESKCIGLNDKDKMSLVSDFFNKLRIYINQPNESQIESVLKGEINQDSGKVDIIFELYHIAVQKWWLKTGSVPWQTKTSQLFNDTISDFQKQSLVKILDKISMNKLFMLNIDFNCDQIKQDLKERIDCLMNGKNKSILNVNSNNRTLSCLKIVQYLQNNSIDFIYLDAEFYSIEYLSKQLEAKINFLVFSCKKQISKEILFSLGKNVSKIIFIMENSSSEYNDSINDINQGLADLSQESQEKVLDSQIIFQGTQLPLRSLIKENINLVDQHTLCQLIKGESIDIAPKKHFTMHDDEMLYYVERTLLRCTIKIDVLNDDSFFIVSNNHSYELPSNKKDVIVLVLTEDKSKNDFFSTKEYMIYNQKVQVWSIVEAQKYYGEICQKYPKKNIHLLKQFSLNKFNNHFDLDISMNETELLWEKSHNSVANLFKFRYNTKVEIDTKTLLEANNKIVLLAAEPGMGKSTFLTALQAQIKQHSPSAWVIRINLLEYSETFSDWQKNKQEIDKSLASDFLQHVEFNVTTKRVDFEKAVFSRQCELMNIILLVDGFDEISPDYQETVLSLLGVFEFNYVKFMWIACRSGLIQEQLELILNTFAYGLQPFNETNVTEFLSNFVNCQSKVNKFDKSTLINDFNNSLRSIDFNEKEFKYVPLHMKMIATLYLDNDQPKYASKQFDLLSLYEKMIEMIFFRLHSEKNKSDPSKPSVKKMLKNDFKTFVRKHQILAMYSMYSESNLKSILSDQKLSEIPDLLDEVKNGEEKTGLIYKVIERKPVFIHQTYTEYFCALSIFEKFKFFDHSKFEKFMTRYTTLSTMNSEKINKFIQLLLVQFKNDINDIIPKSKFILKYILQDDFFFGKCTISQLLQLIECSIELNLNLEFREIIEKVLESTQVILLTTVCKMGFIKIAQLVIDIININAINNAQFSFHVAAFHGHREIVELFLKKDLNVNICATINKSKAYEELIYKISCLPSNIIQRGYTALHLAAREGHIEVVTLLLAKDAKVDATDSNDGWTSLLIASLNGHKDVVQHLLDQKANANSKAKNGVTALYMAAQNGHIEVVALLLARGAYVDAAKENGRTSLIQASQNGHKDVVQLLLDNEANVNSVAKNGVTALRKAAQNGHTKVVALLLARGAQVDAARSNDDTTALMTASLNAHKDVAQHLLEKRAKVDKTESDDDYTSLMIASINGHKDIVQLLLDNEANINSKSKKGVTALYIAAANGHTEIVALLLARGAQVDAASTNDNMTPLMLASFKGCKDVVQLLLDNEANINSKSKNGVTALNIAAANGYTEIVALLLARGAQVDAVESNNNWTPLLFASSKCHKDVVQLLLDNEANVNSKAKNGVTALYMAAHNEHTEVVALLLERGAQVDATESDDDCTPLMIASKNGHKDVVQLLLDNEANVNSKAKNGVTALFMAAHNGHTEVVALLLARGAHVDAVRITENRTPLMAASLNGHMDVVQYLLDNNAKVNSEAKDGVTAFHLAAQNDHTAVMALLLANGAKRKRKLGTSGTSQNDQ